jgi:hypothetical protein
MTTERQSDSDWLREIAFRGVKEGDAIRLHAIAYGLERADGDCRERLEYQLQRIEHLQAENARLRAACQSALRLRGDWRHDEYFRACYEQLQAAIHLEGWEKV